MIEVYLNRDKAIEAIEREFGDEASPECIRAKEAVYSVELADVEPVIYGHWENIENAKNTIRCSNCGHIRELKHFSEIIKRPKFCEMCGAKNGRKRE